MIRPRCLRRTLVAVLAALALVATGCGGGSETSAVVAGDSSSSAAASAASDDSVDAPSGTSLVADTVGGGQIDFASLEGQDVVLWFWAPW